MSAKNILVKNSLSEQFWGGPARGFNVCRDQAVAVDAAELAVLRATYLNCVHETLPAVCAAGVVFLKRHLPGALLTRAETLREIKSAMRAETYVYQDKIAVNDTLLHMIQTRKLRPAVVGRRGARGFQVVA
jgi:hypothetical protein